MHNVKTFRDDVSSRVKSDLSTFSVCCQRKKQSGMTKKTDKNLGLKLKIFRVFSLFTKIVPRSNILSVLFYFQLKNIFFKFFTRNHQDQLVPKLLFLRFEVLGAAMTHI